MKLAVDPGMTSLGIASRKSGEIVPDRIEAYLRSHGHPTAKLVALAPLGAGVQEGLKGHGYGQPLCATFVEEGEEKRVVIRTMRADRYGHERRADRIDNMTLAFDGFASIPKHIRALDLGAFAKDGTMISIAGGEPFLVTEYVDGELYARDLSAMARLSLARPLDLERAETLALYLAELHSVPAAPHRYPRAIRDLVGHGEGIFGLIDAYPPDDELASPARLHALEHAVLDWRWRLRGKHNRCKRTHGDFHPFNLLFRSGCDFSLLDTSRGGAGDPADDVACLSINYLFFSLDERGVFDGALREAWNTFYRVYLTETGDDELPEVIAPFFAWRALVLASRDWYPDIAPPVRDRILGFAEKLLAGRTFIPERVDDLL